MSDGREEREEREARIKQERQTNPEELIDADMDDWEPERDES